MGGVRRRIRDRRGRYTQSPEQEEFGRRRNGRGRSRRRTREGVVGRGVGGM